MRTIIAVLCVAMALSFAAGYAAAEESTLTGEPVDISCYLGGKSGPAHAGCAKSCVSGGKPVGFVVRDGEDERLYLVLGKGKAAKDLLGDHMGEEISVTGEVKEQGGMYVITVAKVG